MHDSGEPSVEEILDSIKKVIARDAQAGSMQDRRPGPRSDRTVTRSSAEPASPEEAIDVLELGEGEIFVDTPPESYRQPSRQDDSEDDTAAIPLTLDDDEPLTLERDMEERAAEAEKADTHEERRGSPPPPLTKSEVRGQAKANFATLAKLMEQPAENGTGGADGTSLEGMVREMLRPMLAQWLDENLPGIVEEMVQAEITRITQEV